MSQKNSARHFVEERRNAFHYAGNGLKHVIKTQKNAWLHLASTIMVIIACFWLGIERMEWALILLAIGLVWLAEFLNTALENAVDLASPEKHPLARIGKDVGAASVLIAAIVAAVIGILILGPPLLSRLGWSG